MVARLTPFRSWNVDRLSGGYCVMLTSLMLFLEWVEVQGGCSVMWAVVQELHSRVCRKDLHLQASHLGSLVDSTAVLITYFSVDFFKHIFFISFRQLVYICNTLTHSLTLTLTHTHTHTHTQSSRVHHG